MPRTARAQLNAQLFHVLNRGNDRATVFHKEGDYRAFLRCFAAAKAHHPVRTFCFCLMPNHFHFLLHADTPGILGAFMHRWMTSHVRRYHAHYRTSGHLWQERFKTFPVVTDAQFLTVFRYVLQNPVRAGMVERADDWRWSSLRFPELIDPAPVTLPRDLHQWLHETLPDSELDHLRTLINRPALGRTIPVPPDGILPQRKAGQAS
jgi:putative transposase